MNQKIILLAILFIYLKGIGQVSNYPFPPTTSSIMIKDATVHVGKDDIVEEQTSVLIHDGKIVTVGKVIVPPIDAIIIEGKGKHLYPGFILCNTQIGLREFSAVRASLDEQEVGILNPSVRSIIAYNTDSRYINAIRDNGILLANVAPIGGIISGKSSVVQFDAWNWEDALYKDETALHFYMPQLIDFSFSQPEKEQAEKSRKRYQEALAQIGKVIEFLKEAKAYCSSPSIQKKNLKFEAVRSLFTKQMKLFIHCDWVKEILLAIELSNSINIPIVIVGGYDSWQIADLLKKYNIPVVLESIHTLPYLEDDNIKQPFITPSILQKAGVLFAINSENSHDRGRNLAFLAGTAASYGLSKEQALQAISLNAAKILGIDNITGSIEVGKDANLILAEGDVLDMKSSTIVEAFIQGRHIKLDNVHKELNRRFEYKYGIKE